jgi:hypothetical protein
MQDVNPEIFSNSKWNIIKEIAEKPSTPTDLAEKTKTSLSNITQQIKLLEAYDIVKGQRSSEKNPGKPKTVYSLSGEFMYGIMLRNGKAERKYFKIDRNNSLLLHLMFTAGLEDVYIIMKFAIMNDEILKKCKAIGFIKSTKDSVELFLVTDSIDEIRAKFSNLFLEDPSGRTKKIINWTHNEFEINDGIQRKDKYYIDMMKNVQVVHDPQGILAKYAKQ